MNASILLIEDEPALRNLFEAVLTRAGYTVATAENGRTAMRILATRAFDVVVTDIVMPEQEGIETIMKIRQLWPGLPIIAMSGGGHVEPERYLRIARSAGAMRLLAKPFAPARLLGCVYELLSPPTTA